MARDSPRRDALALAIVLLVAIGARAALVAARADLSDPDGYLGLARSLAVGEGLSIHGRATAYRPPLWPLVLVPSAWIGPGWALGLNVALGGATVALTLTTARLWGLSKFRSLVAGGIVALDPVLLSQAPTVMTETLAAALVALGLFALARAKSEIGLVWAGAAWGLAGLCRPSLLPAAGLVGALALIDGRRLGALWFLGGSALVLVPWGARNAIAVGAWTLATTHGGHTLALANNPEYYQDVLDGPPGAVWSGPNQERFFQRVRDSTQGMDEAQSDRELARQARALARERPVDFARASLARLGRFWALAPSSRVYPPAIVWGCAAWTVPLFLGAAVGARTCGRWPRSGAIAVVLALTLVHSAYWTDLRMRAPIVPALGLLAASARLFGKFGKVLDFRPAQLGPRPI